MYFKRCLCPALLAALILGLAGVGLTRMSAAITLSWFKATPHADHILVEWETAAEIDALGFYILRSTNANGPFDESSRINPYLIPAQSLEDDQFLLPHVYAYADLTALPGVTYFYVLEEIETPGSSHLYLDKKASGVFGTLTPTAWLYLPYVSRMGTPAPAKTLAPTPTSTATPTQTWTPTITPTSTPSPTPTTCCPPPVTPEPLFVDPVISPTSLLTQTLSIRLGRGRAITVTSEAGTVSVTGTFTAFTPTFVTIPLLPNTTHHLTVTGLVEYATGYFYTLRTTTDRYGHPLIIVQQDPEFVKEYEALEPEYQVA